MKISAKQIILTATTLLFTVLLFELSDIDIRVQDYLYDFESSKWILDRNEKPSELIFYDGIKRVIIAFVLLVIIGILLFKKSSFIKNHRDGLFIFLFSVIFVPLIVGALKATTNIPCPDDLSHYGGAYPHITLFTSYPIGFYQAENIRCYPAGHASGGFALLSLVFFFTRKRSKVIAAVSVLSVAWVMGIYKMFIGDHFLSHTIVTMLLAWLIILIILIIAKCVYAVSMKKGENYNQ